MIHLKKKFSENKKDKTGLEGVNLVYVLLCLFFGGWLIPQAIFYYGWKNNLPKKASQANNWGWFIFVILVIFYYFILPKLSI
jgi:hypothetical protein